MISSQCQTLERLEYKGKNSFGLNGLSNYDPSNNEDKFPNLKYIKIDFRIGPVHESESVALMAKLEKFKNNLSTKCPKLENPIKLDLQKRNIPGIQYGPNASFKIVIFESK